MWTIKEFIAGHKAFAKACDLAMIDKSDLVKNIKNSTNSLVVEVVVYNKEIL